MSALVLLPIASLVVFHLVLLWARVAEGRLTDPEIAGRWAGGLLLTAALLVLRRSGVPLLWGRRALVFWLLVLVLHAGATAPEAPALGAAPADLLFVLPASAAPVTLAVLLLVAHLVRQTADGRPCVSSVGHGAPPPAAGPGVLVLLSPRAPPA